MVKVSQFDLAKKAMSECYVTVPTGVKRADVDKYCEKVINAKGAYKYLYTEEITEVNEVYGMFEEDFLKFAVKLTKDRKFPDGTEIEE